MAISITDRSGATHSVASGGVGAAGLTTGIIGTTLGALAFFREGGLGLGGLLGGHGGHGGGRGEDLLVAGLMSENAMLKAEKYTDRRFEKLQEEICCLKTREAVLCKEVDHLAKDMYYGDKAVKEWCECRFARTRKAICSDEIVDFGRRDDCRCRGEFDNCDKDERRA